MISSAWPSKPPSSTRQTQFQSAPSAPEGDGPDRRAQCPAEMAGDHEQARSYYEQLVALGEMADSERAELAAAQAFLAQK